MNTPMHITKFLDGHTLRLEQYAGAYEVWLDGNRLGLATKTGDRWIAFIHGSRFDGNLDGLVHYVLNMCCADRMEVR